MASHPDTATVGASSEQTEAIVAAFRALRTLTADGAMPLPYQTVEDEGIGPMVLYARPGDVFARMCQAADEIGVMPIVKPICCKSRLPATSGPLHNSPSN